MKKILYLILFTIVLNIIVYTQVNKPNLPERYYEVQLEKSNFVFGEPIFAKFRCAILSGEPEPNFIADSSIKVSFNGETREYTGLSPVLKQGRAQYLPDHPDDRTVKLVPYEKEDVIGRVNEFFPISGYY